MANRRVSIWYDHEGDFLEVIWEVRCGDFIETEDGQAMIKVDDDGNVLAFHIVGVSKMTKPASVVLKPSPEEEAAGAAD